MIITLFLTCMINDCLNYLHTYVHQPRERYWRKGRKPQLVPGLVLVAVQGRSLLGKTQKEASLKDSEWLYVTPN